MRARGRLLNPDPKTLDEQYFADIRPKLYEQHGSHHQHGVRTGRTLAEHLDSACQFVLTASKIAQVPEDKRGLILAATSVHDLNKLDSSGRNVKTLARDKDFLQQQLRLACVNSLIKSEADLELVRRLIERHSGHSASDGMRFLPEDEELEQWAAMLIGADLFDLGIAEEQRIRKVENELTVALGRPSHLFRVKISEDRGYITSLLLGACEEVLIDRGLHPLAIFPDGEWFEGQSWPHENLTEAIARRWQQKIDRVFGGNIEQLVRATKDGIKVENTAIEQSYEETLDCIKALLQKKKLGFKLEKINQDIQKYGNAAGEAAVTRAVEMGLNPVSNSDQFALSEGLKAAYLSYRQTGMSTDEVWDKIAKHTGLSEEQRIALEPFNPQYGRCLFAASAIQTGIEGIEKSLLESFQMRSQPTQEHSQDQISPEMRLAVSSMLNLPQADPSQGEQELSAYIDAHPRKRCSLGRTSEQVEELISNNMPPGTKVQSFSNRLPGGMNAEPKRRADKLASLGYQLMRVGARFPKSSKQDPLYLHFSLPECSSPELLRIWRIFLQSTADTNAEGGTVTVDELQLYRDRKIFFKSNKVIGLALPKNPNFVHATVMIPTVWGEANASVALLKSLRLALELSLALEFGFPFVLSGNLEIEPWTGIYGRVEGIPSSLQALLDTGQYSQLKAEEILDRLRNLGNLIFAVASPQKRDDCLYDLARATQRPLDLYYVLLRWILREQDDPNLEVIWNRIRQPLNDLLESLMPDDNQLTQYLKEAAQLAEIAKLRGSSFRRTAQVEPFADFMAAIRSRKSHLPWDVVFASLVQQYHTRLDRIREHGVGATKYEQVKQYYEVLRKIFDEIYHARPERILADRKTLEAAYLFFLQEARQELKEQTNPQTQTTEDSN